MQITRALRFDTLETARITLLEIRRQVRDCEERGELHGELDALVLIELLGRLKLLGVQWAEISLIDSGDVRLVQMMERMQAEPYKTYRIFEKRLNGS